MSLDLRNYRVESTLKSGNKVIVRAVRSEDAQRLAKYFQEMTPESRYLRFLGFRNSFTARELEYITHPNFLEHATIVATLADGRLDEEIVGEASYISAADGRNADCALSVLDGQRHQGVGALLLEHVVRLAEHWGVKQLSADVLGSNRVALEFLVRRGFRPLLVSCGIHRLFRPLSRVGGRHGAQHSPAPDASSWPELQRTEDEFSIASASV